MTEGRGQNRFPGVWVYCFPFALVLGGGDRLREINIPGTRPVQGSGRSYERPLRFVTYECRTISA